MSLRRGAAALMTTLLVLGAGWQAGARAAQPVRLTAALDPGARLGGATALHLGIHIDTDRIPPPVTEIRLRYPASLGVTTSGLGLASCRRTPDEFAGVVITGTGLAGCPRNAVMARGEAIGEVRFGTLVFPETGTITVLSGPLEQGRLGLVTLVEGWHPVGALLAYSGSVLPAPAPYGGTLAIRLPLIPADWDAVIALNDLDLVIGSRDIVYHDRLGGRTIRYRPEGVVLPARCPRGGFRFHSTFTFQDGTHRTAATTARCPAARGR